MTAAPAPKPRLPFTTFLEHVRASDGKAVKLSPAQRVLVKVAFDGIDPKDLRGPDERPLAAKIFGPIDRVPPEARAVVVAVCGASSGKTYILSALRLLHLALTVPLDSMAPGQQATGVVVAPDLRLAGEVLDFVAGAVETSPALHRALVSRDATTITLRREGRSAAGVVCALATRVGTSVSVVLPISNSTTTVTFRMSNTTGPTTQDLSIIATTINVLILGHQT